MAYSLLSIGIDDFEDHQEYATSFSLHTQLMVITRIVWLLGCARGAFR